uniref:Transposase n=1 Tax=Haemonchus placei TaxID=6290 RepID=A0A0N4X940_HAEPC
LCETRQRGLCRWCIILLMADMLDRIHFCSYSEWRRLLLGAPPLIAH